MQSLQAAELMGCWAGGVSGPGSATGAIEVPSETLLLPPEQPEQDAAGASQHVLPQTGGQQVW